MFRLLIAAAVAVGAWALVRRRQGAAPAPRGYEPSKTHTTIVIGGSSSHPTITGQPERLVARRGEQLIWDVRNDTKAPQEISLRGFRKTGGPTPSPPLDKSDAERTVKADQHAQIKDRVRGAAVGGTYKYDIWLNGQLAVDPEVIIYEGA